MPSWFYGFVVVVIITVVTFVYIYVEQGTDDTLAGLSCDTGQVAAFDGDGWICADPAAGDSGPGFSLRDANDNPIGTVIDVTRATGSMSVAVLIPVSRLGADFATDERNIVLLARTLSRSPASAPQPGFSFVPHPVLFDDVDCEGGGGQAHTYPEYSLLPAISASAAPNNANGEQHLFVATGAAPVSAAPLSESYNGCHANSNPALRSLLPVELLVSNLDQIFPPPFSLHIE